MAANVDVIVEVDVVQRVANGMRSYAARSRERLDATTGASVNVLLNKLNHPSNRLVAFRPVDRRWANKPWRAGGKGILGSYNAKRAGGKGARSRGSSFLITNSAVGTNFRGNSIRYSQFLMGTYASRKTGNPIVSDGSFAKVRDIVDLWTPSFRETIARTETSAMKSAIKTGRPKVNLALLRRG